MVLPRHLSRHLRSTRPAQAMVEFALILPILALLLVLAIDFGRVFFGWVSINNAARIGANEAAKSPTIWADGNPTDDYEDIYFNRIAQDLAALNCDADTDDDGDIDRDDLPQPVFTDQVDDPADPYEVGDHVSVTLQCDFGFVTPLAGMVAGDPLTIGATATFTVFGGEINGIPVAEIPETMDCALAGTAEVPDLVGMSVATARATWSAKGFTGTFNPPPGPTDGDLVTAQNTSPASVPGDCLSVSTTTITVTTDPPDPCSPPDATVPILTGTTVGEARTTWEATFSGAFNAPGAADSDKVTGQTQSDGSQPNDCVSDLTISVTVTFMPTPTPPPSSCSVTQLLGWTPAAAQAHYQTRGFTGNFTTTPPNKPSWVVKSQSLVANQPYACTASLEVDLEKP